MKKVYKFPCAPNQILGLFTGFGQVYFAKQNDQNCIWAEVNPNNEREYWKVLKIKITAFPDWEEVFTLPKGSILLGGEMGGNPEPYYLWFLTPANATENEECGYALSDTGTPIKIDSAKHVGIFFDNDLYKSTVIHIYRYK